MSLELQQHMNNMKVQLLNTQAVVTTQGAALSALSCTVDRIESQLKEYSKALDVLVSNS